MRRRRRFVERAAQARRFAGKAWAEASPRHTGHGLDTPPWSLPGSACACPASSASLSSIWQMNPGSKPASNASSAGIAWNLMTLWRATVAVCSKIAATANQLIQRRQRIPTPWRANANRMRFSRSRSLLGGLTAHRLTYRCILPITHLPIFAHRKQTSMSVTAAACCSMATAPGTDASLSETMT